jgi:hypothetical protein
MDKVNVWICPADKRLPIRAREIRIAVGSPNGASTNSWKIWVRKDDVYVACRDNFQGLKVSLHASGVWRVGYTREFAASRPDLVLPGSDRALKKWSPDVDAKLVLGFQLACPDQSLYLMPGQRTEWPHSVLFVEQPPQPKRMTVLSVIVVSEAELVSFDGQTVGAVVGILPLGETRTVQIVATYEDDSGVLDRIEDAGREAARRVEEGQVPANGIFFALGERLNDVPWFCAVPYVVVKQA